MYDYCLGGITLRPRTRDEVARFFDGLDAVEPGLVRAPDRYRDTTAPPASGRVRAPPYP
ncbi:SAM-dependent methyltransferase [Streptomyces niveus]|uniref:SAM-dependent methyltransferase n=1 Tax=Streptomyces niveus TaxID=193462 RepID=UPI003D03DEE4